MTRCILAALILILSLGVTSFAQEVSETPQQRDARMKWWREAKFGMFIHWGVYSVPAGTYKDKQIEGIGEWIMLRGKIPVNEYRAFAKDFTAAKYDPDAWAQVAKDAGMNYMVITSKHHDGFALFDSAVTEWDAVDASGAKRDLIKPLADAARSRGLKFGLYYSQAQDWNHPGGAKSRYQEGEVWDDAQKGKFDDYLQKIAIPQTKEILEKFHPDVLWWDTPTWMTAERAKPLHDLLATCPGIITNNRLGGGFRGDTETPEQHIPATGYPGRDWETCMTINGTWGFKSYDHNWKSVTQLSHNLIDIVSKGGNYLLNVGPTREGEIPRESIDRLLEIGKWLKANGEAIYSTTASPFERLPAWGRVTQKPGKLFLHVWKRPEAGRIVLPMKGKITHVALLTDPSKSFDTSVSEDGVAVICPPSVDETIATVLVADVEGDVLPIRFVAQPDANGVIVLPADKAILGDGALKSQADPAGAFLTNWTNNNNQPIWTLNAPTAGKYSVTLEYACADEQKGTSFSIEADGKKLDGKVESTGGDKAFKRIELGVVELKAGEVKLVVKPGKIAVAKGQVMNLRSIALSLAK